MYVNPEERVNSHPPQHEEDLDQGAVVSLTKELPKRKRRTLNL
jgi:hypothetical protein